MERLSNAKIKMPDAEHESIVNDKNEQQQFHFCSYQFITVQPANGACCSSSSQQGDLAFANFFSLKVNEYRIFSMSLKV